VHSIAMHPSGAFCVVGYASGLIQMWDHKHYVKKGSLQDSHGLKVAVNGVSFQGNGICFASVGAQSHKEGGAVKLWNIEFAQEWAMLKPEGHIHRVKSLSFSSSGDVLASAGARNVKLWNRGSGHLRTALAWSKEAGRRKWHCSSVAFTPDGHLIACTFSSLGATDHVVIFEVKSGEEKRALPVDSATSVNAIRFSPNGLVLALGMADGAVNMWQLVGEDQRTSGHFAAVNAVAFSLDSATLATGSNDGEIKLWNVEKARIVAELKGHAGAVSDLQYSPVDTNVMASASQIGEVILWDLNLKCMQLQLRRADNDVVNSLSFSPDSQLLALGFQAHRNSSGMCEIWSVSEAKVIPGGSLRGHRDSCSSVEFSPDTNIKRMALASASGKDVFTLVTNDTAKVDAIAEAKAVQEMDAKATAQLGAAQAAESAAKEATEALAAASKVMKSKTEAAREASEVEDTGTVYQANQDALLAIKISLQSAQDSLPILKEDMETKLARFSQLSADLEVASEEQAEAVICQKSSIEEMEQLKEDAMEQNQLATKSPTPENERRARDAVEKHELAKEAHEEALKAVKAAMSYYEEVKIQKATAFQVAAAAKQACDAVALQINEFAEQIEHFSELLTQ